MLYLSVKRKRTLIGQLGLAPAASQLDPLLTVGRYKVSMTKRLEAGILLSIRRFLPYSTRLPIP